MSERDNAFERGARLRLARKTARVNRSELAEAAGVTPAMIRDGEQAHGLTADQLDAYLTALRRVKRQLDLEVDTAISGPA